MRKWILGIAVILLISMLGPVAYATEVEPMAIFSVEDLLTIKENPAGSYILMADLDMSGIEWTPLDLDGGSFDGNGHAILNLTINTVGNTTGISYDGNKKSYETCFAGFFGVISNANISNLKLVNVRANVASDTPCFLGSIAGAMYDSVVTDCTVSGILELYVWDRMFGVGGIVGYGNGSVERCTADMTLVCTDSSKDVRDEQFLGGVCAAGLVNVIDCNVTLDGYVSEYGYVHNGGLVGMLIDIAPRNGQKGYMTGNSVKGKITFFERNGSRRAYCEPYIGEILAYNYVRKDNVEDFESDERKDYTVTLHPEMCENPVYNETVVAPGCDTFGYTEYACQSCEYKYRDQYTLTQHTVSEWTVTKEPTLEEPGMSVAICIECGLEYTQEEAQLVATEPTTQSAEGIEEMLPALDVETKETNKLPYSREVIYIPITLAICFILGLVLRSLKERFLE